mmetsp:Transcript_6523/g.10132  ORF Transcript_6523/g.10132 Transcript_6523/m.10132 type:complete len:103 (-) Transcript_6523:1113-1421(-)
MFFLPVIKQNLQTTTVGAASFLIYKDKCQASKFIFIGHSLLPACVPDLESHLFLAEPPLAASPLMRLSIFEHHHNLLAEVLVDHPDIENPMVMGSLWLLPCT